MCSSDLVEDDAINMLAGKRVLEKSGFAVTGAGNGRQALDALRQGAFDLILMDIQMPVMDGLTAAKAIRDPETFGPKSSIPIIAMTAYAMEGDREAFLKAGMDGYVAKPMEPADLLAVIRKTMKKERAAVCQAGPPGANGMASGLGG